MSTRFLIISFTVIAWCVSGIARAEETSALGYVSFREQVTLTSDWPSQPVKGAFNYKHWFESQEGEGHDDLFDHFLINIYRQSPEERKHYPNEFEATPLFWAATISDNAPAIDTSDWLELSVDQPTVIESYIARVRNKTTGTSYLVCICRIPGRASWQLVPYADAEEKIEFAPWPLCPDQAFEADLNNYLQRVDFGPNAWDKSRCASLRIFSSTDDEQNSHFPVIAEQLKNTRYAKYEAMISDE